MTLVYGICRDGAGLLIADTATIIPTTKQANHPFTEPVLKILTIGESVIGYAGNTYFLPDLISNASKTFPELTSQALECHRRSQQELEFIVLRRDGQEMMSIREGSAIRCRKCYVGSQAAFREFRRKMPHTEPSSYQEEFSIVQSAFSKTLLEAVDGVSGLPISYAAGHDTVGYVTQMSNTVGPIELDECEVHADGWRTLPLTNRLGGQFTVVITGVGHAGVCIGYPQPGIGFLFAADTPEPIIKMAIPSVSYRDLSAYDLANMADALDAGAIQVGIPDSFDIARTLASFLRELDAEKAEPPGPALSV